MTKDTVFYFGFELRDDNLLFEKGFIIKGLDDKFDEQDDFIKQTEDLESEFGVHDWFTSPCPEVNGIGYGSYEVQADQIDTLMDKWRQYFVGIVGEDNVSKIVSYDQGHRSDLEVYNKIKSILADG